MMGCASSLQAAKRLCEGLCCSQAELKSGEMYRGELVEAEDSWNVQLKNVTATSKVHFSCCLAVTLLLTGLFSEGCTEPAFAIQDGRNSHLEHIFIRGSRVR